MNEAPTDNSRFEALPEYHPLLTRATADAASRESTPALAVQLVYEDAQTGARAWRAFDRLAEGLNLQTDFRINLWRFDLLCQPGFRELAGNELIDADILLVSAHGRQGLPTHVHACLHQWLSRDQTRPRALVVSLDPPAGDCGAASQILASLRAGAGMAGVEVFPHFGGVGDSPDITLQDIEYRAGTRTVLMEEAMTRANTYAPWGLNE